MGVVVWKCSSLLSPPRLSSALCLASPADSPATETETEAAAEDYWPQPSKTPPQTEVSQQDDDPTEQPLPEAQWREVIREHWMVVLGGLCLVFAGVFLVAYSIEHGLLGPTGRVVAGLLFGTALLIAGEYLRRSDRLEAKVHAVLVAAGALVVYSSLLVAHALYQLIPANAAFAAMSLMSAGTLVLALKHGPMMAGMGVLGAYAVPELVNTGSNAIEAALLYSLVVSGAAFWLQRYVYRSWLWWGTWIGAAAWLLVSLGLPAQAQGLRELYIAALAYGSVALSFAGLQLSAISQEHVSDRPVRTQIYASMLGLSGALFVCLNVEQLNAFSYPAAAVYPLVAALIARHNLPTLRWLPLIALMPIVVDAFASNYQLVEWVVVKETLSPALQTPYLLMLSVIALGYAGMGFYQVRAQRHPMIWAPLGLFVPLFAIVLAVVQVSGLQNSWHWAAYTTLLASAYLFLFNTWRQRGRDTDVESVLAFATQAAFAVVAFIAFSGVTLTLVLAAQLLGLSLLYRRYGAAYLPIIIKLMVSLIVVRLTLNPWILLYRVDQIVILLTYLGAFASAALSAWLLRDRHALLRWLYGAAAHLLVLSLAVCTRYLMYDGNIFALEFSLTEAAIYANSWAAIGLIYDRRSQLLTHHQQWHQGLAMIHFIAAAGLYVACLLLMYNPLLHAQAISTTPIFNILLLAYGLPVLLGAQVVRQVPRFARPAGLLTVVGFFVFITLEVRHLWHGDVNPALPVISGELYSYSLAWLLTALALLVFGALLEQRDASRAGTAALLLVIAKVFLWDMSDLEGLWRVVSFLGLGASLLGVAFLFKRLQASSARISDV